jgi:hypothetical protein
MRGKWFRIYIDGSTRNYCKSKTTVSSVDEPISPNLRDVIKAMRELANEITKAPCEGFAHPFCSQWGYKIELQEFGGQ